VLRYWSIHCINWVVMLFQLRVPVVGLNPAVRVAPKTSISSKHFNTGRALTASAMCFVNAPVQPTYSAVRSL
jgi:hypothetical protein